MLAARIATEDPDPIVHRVSTREATLPTRTMPGAVRLIVADLDRAKEFYERTIGLEPLERSDDVLRLGTGGATLIELAHDPDAPARPHGTTGLFHLAILVPDRPALAAALRRAAGARGRFSGASDHLVSEALYLRDPEGNGIEIYRDRPRTEWSRSNGELQMDSLPLDLDDLLAEPEPQQAARMPRETRIGHVHLNVSDLAAAEAFYAGLLGFDVTVRGYPGALFVAAGDYHHHVGLNTWAGEGAPQPPHGACGLRWFELVLPSHADVQEITARLEQGGFRPEPEAAGVLVADPAGNGILLR